MDIVVRGIDAIAVKKMDEEAKKKGISRNEYLKRFIEKWAKDDLFKNEQAFFDEVVEKNNKVLEEVLDLLPDIKLQIVKNQIMAV